MKHVGLNAHLLSSEPGYRAAGIHTVIHHLLRNLGQQAGPDWRFTALVGREQTARYPGLTMRRAAWDTRRPSRRILWEQAVQPGQLRQFDLYHALAFAAPLALPVPMVVTVYDLTFMRYPQRLSAARRRYLRLMTDLTCRRARRVFAISHSTGRDLTDLLGVPPEKIIVTPLGYDQERFRPLPLADVAAFKAQKGLPERFWLFLGTLEPRKNIPVLLEAYAQIAPRQRLPLVLAGGEGWGMDAIHATIARHRLTQDVTFTGFVPTSEVPLWYNSAEIFVYPSVFEGFGLPVLEAMACGTPVITSNVSSLPEVAEGVGLTLAPDDPSGWTDALRRAFYDSNWRAQAQQAGLERAQHFQWSITARQTIAGYQRALELDD